MSLPQSACQPWCGPEDLCAPCDTYDADPVLQDRMIDVATDLLFALSGRQFPGSCDAVVRPCLPSCRRTPCRCGYLPQIDLGAGPITSITEVKVDGTTLDSSLYRLDDSRFLVRLPDPNGRNPGWPGCQRFDLPSTQKDTVEISFTYGIDPPASGVLAAAVLACELIKSCSPEELGECRLPARVQQLTRQGVTMQLIDPTALLGEKRPRFGITEIDAFLTAHNPNALQRGATVMSPDYPPKARRVGA